MHPTQPIAHIPAYSHPHLRGEQRNYQKFIVLTHPRSGSNHLVSYLASHRRVVAFAELFQERHMRFNYEGYPAPDNGELLALRDGQPETFLDETVFRAYAPHVSAVGFKIFYNQPAGGTTRDKVWEYIHRTPGLKIIHLRRRNLLSAFVSLKKAIKTDQWIVTDPAQATADFEVSLGYDECLAIFESALSAAREFTDRLGGKDQLNVFYEDLVADGPAEMERVQQFLEVEQETLCSTCIRQNTRPLRGIVTNYQELKDKFRGSPWEHCFDE